MVKSIYSRLSCLAIEYMVFFQRIETRKRGPGLAAYNVLSHDVRPSTIDLGLKTVSILLRRSELSIAELGELMVSCSLSNCCQRGMMYIPSCTSRSIPFRSPTSKKSPPSYAALRRSDRHQILSFAVVLYAIIPEEQFPQETLDGNSQRRAIT